MIQPQDQTSKLPFSEKFHTSGAHTYLWRALYLGAIFERERAKLPARIRVAEQAVMRREHELCVSKQGSAERESIITALNCLDALGACIKAI